MAVLAWCVMLHVLYTTVLLWLLTQEHRERTDLEWRVRELESRGERHDDERGTA